ncbi:glycerol-3-phosphate acyltransferase [Psychrobacillus sp. AK 1817]|uniref:glycerol-3-phosphate acyltransferase n=1 Tax=Psychrobacillus sp. AK 1817 TaxID=2303505 RepID=UPI00119F84EF|nr:glycerol-3-phosphate acyltransferase [Psychrobacillus sp. AK 1817]QEY20938.1 glycerol-3-phosphate acyltransferase [Psychrobacillus sp. AK 1817]
MLLLYWIFSYFVGNFLTAWWVGKWKNTDLRTERSGNLGARNAGAVLGKAAFVLTFVGDALKGILVLYVGYVLDFSTLTIATGAFFVIIGHLYPLWLKGKGGKGIATFIGVSLALNPFLFGMLAVVFLLLLSVIRSATLSMILAFSAYGILCLVIPEYQDLAPLSLIIIIIIIKHRHDVVDSWHERWWNKSNLN